MNPRRPEMADIVRTHHSEFLARWNPVLSREQRKALRDIRGCRSAALGGRVEQCDRCGHRVILYNSCRNRHCPKCQATARARWLAQRETALLPVPYFHVVFTLPSQIGRLALQNPRLIYSILFRTAAATLLETAPIPDCSALTSASLPCCIPGDRTSICIRTCLAWYPAAASRSMARAGSGAESPPSSCPCACSAIAFGNRFYELSTAHSAKAAFASTAR